LLDVPRFTDAYAVHIVDSEGQDLLLANLLQALAHLTPREIPAGRKLGRLEPPST